jgi:hypothetical protein
MEEIDKKMGKISVGECVALLVCEAVFWAVLLLAVLVSAVMARSIEAVALVGLDALLCYLFMGWQKAQIQLFIYGGYMDGGWKRKAWPAAIVAVLLVAIYLVVGGI